MFKLRLWTLRPVTSKILRQRSAADKAQLMFRHGVPIAGKSPSQATLLNN